MKFSIVLLFFAFLWFPKAAVSQNLNAYKYVIVPEKFDLFEEKDKYQLNALTEFLFEKYGFTAILEGEDFPVDLANDRCSALTVDVNSDSERFSFVTKIIVVLENCHQEIVFKSKEGRSRLKDYKFAYQEALRDAFSSIKALNYSYSEPSNNLAVNAEKNRIPETAIFEYNGNQYVILKEDRGMVLKKQGTAEPIAFLNETSKGSFLFRSDDFNGTAYFDDTGSLVVEYFDTGANVIKKRTYTKK